MISNTSIDHIYQQLTSLTVKTANICDEFIDSINEIQNKNKFNGYKSLTNAIKRIQQRCRLLDNFCGLWNNPSDSRLQLSIKDSIDNATCLYLERQSQYGFGNITIRHKQNGELLKTKDKKESIESFFINIKNNKLALVPYILIDNATKYAQKGSGITITYNYIDNEKGIITIENTGPIISETEEIFQQGYRGDNACKIRPNQGQGQGLYFAKNILETLNCKIELKCGDEINRLNAIPYCKISFEITLYAENINSAVNTIDPDYYHTIDDMFSHEYFNIKDNINKLYQRLYENINKQYINIGLTEQDAEQLNEKLQILNIAIKGLFVILNTYAYRKDLDIGNNRSNGVYWSKLYREAEQFYKQELEDAFLNIDFKIMYQHIFGLRRHRANNYNDVQTIHNYWCIEYIPFLIYNFIISYAKGTQQNPSNVIITLTPSNNNGYYIWHNTIEVEVNSYIQNKIIQYIKTEDEPSDHIELSIKMLKLYLQKVQSTQSKKLDFKITTNNTYLKIEFPITSENKY